jgi:AcrR family transcriptional regulator
LAQYLKDEVKERIVDAALDVFARKGFARATMVEIASRAGVSTGNIYRYFANKQVLFDEAVPVRFARRFSDLMRRRVEALAGVADVRTLEPGSSYHAISEELLAFSIDNRLRVVILLGRAQGTAHEMFAGEMISAMSKRAIAHFRRLNPSLRVTSEVRFDLDLIYTHFVRTMVAILTEYEDATRIRAAVESFSRYHLSGLKALMG